MVLGMLCIVAQSCSTLYDPMDCSLLGSSVHGDSLGKNIGVGCYALLQGIFPTQESNLGVPHCRQILTVWTTRWPRPNGTGGQFVWPKSDLTDCQVVSDDCGMKVRVFGLPCVDKTVVGKIRTCVGKPQWMVKSIALTTWPRIPAGALGHPNKGTTSAKTEKEGRS